jgi:porin
LLPRLDFRCVLKRALLAPAGFLAAATLCSPLALADSSNPSDASTAQPQAGASSAPQASPPSSGSTESPNLFGDLGGLRPALNKVGATLNLQEQSEILGNLSGGRRRGFEYEGLTTGTLQLDTQPALGWAGGLFNVSGLQIHGRNLSADNLGTLQLATAIEADSATRLWELWYQQKMFDDKVDIKIGQQSIDQEFTNSPSAATFLNSTFGWAELPAANMPGGGPAYPLSALGVRARAHPTDTLTIQAGVFNGSPVFHNFGDPQKQNPSGTSFPLNGGVLAITELQYAFPGAKAGEVGPLPGVYKIGFWYDSEKFADLRYGAAGVPLASPASSGAGATHRGDYAFYAVVDQMIYRFADDADHSLNVFFEPSFTPLQDRNLVALSLNGGVTMHEPIVGRKSDTAGLGFGFAQVSASASGFNRDTAFFDPGVFSPVRHSETFIEATYQYQATAWWQIQPDFQYVFNPGAGIVDPNAPTHKIRNEAIVGVRANITF